MAKILPFQAFHFDTSRVVLEDVLTQPYDKITPQMQEAYYARSPFNLIRVELGKKTGDDNAEHSVYTRAAAFLNEMREKNVLLQEPTPAILAYSQTFQIPGSTEKTMERRGFIAIGAVQDYGDKIVYRHEQTLSKPKADRLDLLRA